MPKQKLAGPRQDQHPMEDIVQVRLMRVNEVINQMRRHSVGAIGLRSTDLRILNILYDVESVSINELARRAYVDKAWISRSVVQLLEKKWISKQQDPNDSRAQLVRLTQKSRTLLDKVRPQVLLNEQILLQGINEAAFKKNLDILLENAVALLEQRNATDARKRKPLAKSKTK
ncbi:MAG: MarR family winged helix-turn-helix transcriptional regulator [Pseudohongiellaceae bacterium]